MNMTLLQSPPKKAYESLTIHLKPEIITRLRHDGKLCDAIREVLNINPRTMFTKLKENHIDLTVLAVLELICTKYDLELHEIIIQQR